MSDFTGDCVALYLRLKGDTLRIVVQCRQEQYTVKPSQQVPLFRVLLLLMHARPFICMEFPPVPMYMGTNMTADEFARDYYRGVCAILYHLVPHVGTFGGKTFAHFTHGQTQCICVEDGIYVSKPDYPSYEGALTLNTLNSGIGIIMPGYITLMQPYPQSCSETARLIAGYLRPPPAPEPTRRYCAACRAPGATKRCAQCKICYYCNENCQKTDYKKHRRDCTNGVPFLRMREAFVVLARAPALQRVMPNDLRLACSLFICGCDAGQKPTVEMVSKIRFAMFDIVLKAPHTDDWIRFYRAQFYFT